jgi:AAA ATPase domain
MYGMPAEDHQPLIDLLEVRNFRGLEHVLLQGLGRVNLIVGKNNTGKTTLLEAIRFYATTGSPAVALGFLSERDETFDAVASNGDPRDPAASALLSLFYGRQELKDIHSEIVSPHKSR